MAVLSTLLTVASFVVVCVSEMPPLDLADCSKTEQYLCLRRPVGCMMYGSNTSDPNVCTLVSKIAMADSGHVMISSVAKMKMGTTPTNYQYIAVGFSKSAGGMENNSVSACIMTKMDGKQSSWQVSYNIANFASDDKANQPMLDINTTPDSKYIMDLKTGMYDDGYLACEYRRMVKPTDDMNLDPEKVFDLSSFFFIGTTSSFFNNEKRRLLYHGERGPLFPMKTVKAMSAANWAAVPPTTTMSASTTFVSITIVILLTTFAIIPRY